MNVADLERYYKTPGEAQKTLGIKSRQTWANWKRKGIPSGEQCRIEILTAGALKADVAVVQKVA